MKSANAKCSQRTQPRRTTASAPILTMAQMQSAAVPVAAMVSPIVYLPSIAPSSGATLTWKMMKMVT